MGPSLSEWIDLCRGAGVDDEIVGGMWGSGGITPPPVAHPPITRHALERARHLAAEAENAVDPERSLREALAWLGHPHPRASAQVRREMRRLEAELLERARARG